MKNCIIKKNIIVFFILTLLLISCHDNKNNNESKKIIKIAVPKASPAIPLIYMKDYNVLGENIEIDIQIWNSPEQLIAMTQDESYNLLAMPMTVLAKLYNKNIDIKLLNVSTWNLAYFVTTDKTIKTWNDLKSKTIYVPHKSSTPDILTQFFIKNANLKPNEDINIKYLSSSEIAQLLIAGKIEYATLTEPNITMAKAKNNDIEILFNFNDEWRKLKNSNLNIPNAGFVANNTFINENKELIDNFVIEYEKAVDWVLENREEASLLAEEYLAFNKENIKNSIHLLGLDSKTAVESKTDLNNFYELLLNFDSKTIGGKIPNDDMYYQKN